MSDDFVRSGRSRDGTAAERRAWRDQVVPRIRWAVRRIDHPMAAIERAAEVSPGTLGHAIRGNRGLAWGALARLAEAMRVRAAWLAFGEGPAWWELRCGAQAWRVRENGTEGWGERHPQDTARFTILREVREVRGFGSRIVAIVPRRCEGGDR